MDINDMEAQAEDIAKYLESDVVLSLTHAAKCEMYLLDAYTEYIGLKNNIIKPQAEMIDGKWFVSSERLECCKDVHPAFMLKHIRSIRHIAEKYSVPAQQLKKFIAKESR